MWGSMAFRIRLLGAMWCALGVVAPLRVCAQQGCQEETVRVCNETLVRDLVCTPGDEQPCVTRCDSVGIYRCNDPSCECTPPAEVCNGQDDDCDSVVDEGTLNACGACGPAPAEVCNAADDDCDGVIDEDVPPREEVCDGVDEDCDGAVDEGALNACGRCGPAPDEICNGVDDDCDGATDEGLRNACGRCGPVPDEQCNSADDDCDGLTDEGVVRSCLDPLSCVLVDTCRQECPDLPEERCNNRDDDCDGEVDEGQLKTCEVVVRDGESCRREVRTLCAELACPAPPRDVCNLEDDDCDGRLDEDDQPCPRIRGGGCSSSGAPVVPGLLVFLLAYVRRAA